MIGDGFIGGFASTSGLQKQASSSSSAARLQPCPGNSSTVKKRAVLLARSPRDGGSPRRAGEESESQDLVQKAPLTMAVVQPLGHASCPDLQSRSPMASLAEAMSSSGGRRGVHRSLMHNDNHHQGMMPGERAPEHWRRLQKRPVKLGSAYSSRMRAILTM
jgi:hypothetical protein